MSFEITKVARNLKDQIQKTPQLILEIDGIDYRFSTGQVLRYPTFDEVPPLLFDDGLFFDTPIADNKGLDLITFKGSSSDIRQQLIPEKGGAGGVQSFAIAILNKDKILNSILSGELLGKDARVSLGFLGGSFPEDFSIIFEGFIDSYKVKHGLFILNIAHPDQLKRQEILNLVSTELTSPIDNSVTTIPVLNTGDFFFQTLAQEENFISYIRIDDEIMKITAINANDFQVLRNQLGSSASSHDDETEVQSFYRLLGNPINLALKLMLSGGDANYADSVTVDRFVKDSDGNTIPNTIYFNFNIQYLYNVVEGDFITVTGATNGANNVTRTILEVVATTGNSYVIVDGANLVEETLTSAVCSFQSQYNTMPVGLGMKNRNIDFEGINNLDSLLGASLPDIDIYVRDEINAKEFIESELFKPCGLFFIPRKGRTSIFSALPPINTGETFVIDETNITNITDLAIQRSSQRNFYNTIAYKFEESATEEKFKAGVVYVNNEAFDNIPVGNKTLVIEAKGFRESPTIRDQVAQRAQKLLDKYSGAPEFLEGVRVLYKDSYQIEIGDIVVFGSENLQIPKGGKDYFQATLMEVTDKKISIETGRIELSLLNSGYTLNGRFPVISPASYIESSSSSDIVILKDSQALPITKNEVDKWKEFIGKKVKIRDVLFTKEEILTIKDISVGNIRAVQFTTNLVNAIAVDDILELPDYDDSSDYHKASYGYFNPSVYITNVIDASNIECDVSQLFIGSYCEIHSPEWTDISQEVTIADIVGNQVTFSEPLNYTPLVGDVIDLIGFKSDEGLPYRYI